MELILTISFSLDETIHPKETPVPLRSLPTIPPFLEEFTVDISSICLICVSHLCLLCGCGCRRAAAKLRRLVFSTQERLVCTRFIQKQRTGVREGLSF